MAIFDEIKPHLKKYPLIYGFVLGIISAGAVGKYYVVELLVEAKVGEFKARVVEAESQRDKVKEALANTKDTHDKTIKELQASYTEKLSVVKQDASEEADALKARLSSVEQGYAAFKQENDTLRKDNNSLKEKLANREQLFVSLNELRSKESQIEREINNSQLESNSLSAKLGESKVNCEQFKSKENRFSVSDRDCMTYYELENEKKGLAALIASNQLTLEAVRQQIHNLTTKG
ncbi:hypothetical protein K6Q96_06805 [Grimontia kaedaensis]|uniref:Chromosome partitioning protein ParA n=1 Tax=Grimontia kaedaensis TaxID=2872157 RepID=A0ABY4WXJ3_9GAMM|nr:hypothetical protein [Grimontia kaedaensis]USH03696.1 hypothetical protein K6Q96_06805 [Grimontia kaedaensis]